MTVGLTYFHNDLSNVIGFNGLFETLNLGAAERRDSKRNCASRPIADLLFTATYTYLDAEKTPRPTSPTARRASAAPAAERSLRFSFLSLVEKAADDDRSEVRERA